MYEFNNSNIITGLIKQKLHTFNLPVCKVFNSENDLDNYLNNITITSNTYLDVLIKKYKNNRDCLVHISIDENNNIKKDLISYYLYGRSYLNLTKNLNLENNIYDIYTHKYLGEYLRFERDYNNVDLLSLYNCYCNKFEQDDKYIYEYIPVKYGKQYTLCLNNIKNINYIKTTFENLIDIQDEFNKKSEVIKLISFKEPYLFTINNAANIDELNKEKDLKIILRLPKNIITSTVCLEGNFTKTSTKFLNIEANFEKDFEEDYEKLNLTKYISNLSLLQENYSQNKVSYPFATKLIEYLLDNAITQNDNISNNIISSITNAHLRYTDIIDKLKKEHPNYTKEKIWEIAKKSLGKIEGTFTTLDRVRFNQILNENKLIKKDNLDNLFYVDKTVELALNDERYPDKLSHENSSSDIKLIYTLSSDGTYYIVTGYENKGKSATIPSTYSNLPVRKIENEAFKNNHSLKSITIGANITSIGTSAFEDCSTLKSVHWEPFSQLTTIEPNAFKNCLKLLKIAIPNNVKTIGKNAFENCNSLEEIYLPFVGYNGISSEATEKTSFKYIFNTVPSNLKKVTINKGIVAEEAFKNCTYITTIILNSNVTYVGNYAFKNCYGLKNITILGAITSGNYILDDCNHLTNINIPNAVNIDYIDFQLSKNYLEYVNINGYNPIIPSVISANFTGCTKLKTAILNGLTSGNFSFSGCTALETVELPSLVNVPARAFEDCTSLKNIDISNAVSIGNRAFKGTSIESIVIPDTTTSLGDSVFYNCDNLKTVTIGNSISSLDYTFSGCNSLETVIFNKPSSVTSLNRSFTNCSSLKNITIPHSVTTITSSTFYGCTNLESIIIPNSVTTFTDGDSSSLGVFGNCSNLKNIIFEPNSSLTKIGTYCFYNCSSLESIEIPKSVTLISGATFQGCSNLTSVTFENNSQLTTINNNSGSLVYNANNLKLIELPDLVVHIGDSFRYNNFDYVVLPTSLEYIGANAFFNYFGTLTLKVFYKGNATQWAEINTNSTDYSDVLYYYSIEEPTTEGKYWHYLDGVPTVWPVIQYTLNQAGTEYSIGASFVSGAFTIPSSYSGLPVTAISDNGFKDCTELTSITIPNSITTIGNNAFENCTGLTELIIPTSVTSIGQYSIAGCNNLETICFGNNISLGYRCFNNTTAIKRIYFNGTIEDWCNIYNNTTIWNSENRSNPYYRLESIAGVVMENPEYIPELISGDYFNFYLLDENGSVSFNGNTYSQLTNLVIPDTISSLQAGTFTSLVKVSSLTLSNNMTTLSGNFNGFLNLSSLHIGQNISSINIIDTNTGTFGLLLNPHLTTITVDANNSIYDSRNNCNAIIETASNTLILGCGSTVIPNTITTLGYYCFAFNLTSITIPTSVTTIQTAAFGFCTSLTELTYLGTMSDWNNITLESDWNAESSITTIHCTDGDITL